MFLGCRVTYPRGLSPAVAVPNACMSLEALWSKHLSRSVPSSVNTSREIATVVPSSSSVQNRPVRESRKRPADVLPQQNKTPKGTSNSFPTGLTDLGTGSSVIFQPFVFTQSDSQRLYKALQVGSRKAVL